jgi:hypothetical protein
MAKGPFGSGLLIFILSSGEIDAFHPVGAELYQFSLEEDEMINIIPQLMKGLKGYWPESRKAFWTTNTYKYKLFWIPDSFPSPAPVPIEPSSQINM